MLDVSDLFELLYKLSVSVQEAQIISVGCKAKLNAYLKWRYFGREQEGRKEEGFCIFARYSWALIPLAQT